MTRDGAGLRRLFTEGRPAEVAALGTPGVPRGRATAGGLRVDAGARQAANGLHDLEELLGARRPLSHGQQSVKGCRNLRLAAAFVRRLAALDRDPAGAPANRAGLGFGHAARKAVLGAAVEAADQVVSLGLLSLFHA